MQAAGLRSRAEIETIDGDISHSRAMHASCQGVSSGWLAGRCLSPVWIDVDTFIRKSGPNLAADDQFTCVDCVVARAMADPLVPLYHRRVWAGPWLILRIDHDSTALHEPITASESIS